MRRLALTLALLVLTQGCAARAQPEEAPLPRPPMLRALLVGVDRFAQQPDTTPANELNLQRLSRALRADRRGYYSIRRSLNQRMDAQGFAQLLAHSFGGAQPQDTSLIYISTHGLYEEGQHPMDFAMVLSDGEEDYPLTARELHQALEGVPGKKLLIIDTCNAGALIDRGMPGNGLRSLFAGPDYKVLTASGGSEPSFLWTTGWGETEGSSYFADALLSGITASGRFAADLDRDGQITLRELHSYLLNNYGASTPRAYPLRDDSVFFTYSTLRPMGPPRQISAVEYDSASLSQQESTLSFSYTLQERSRVAYQLIYRDEAGWRFPQAQVVIDSELPSGETMPGRKERSLSITGDDPKMSGHVLLFLTTVEEDRSTPYAEKLLLVEPAQGDPQLAVSVPAAVDFGAGEEMPIHIAHAFPLRLTVQVMDEAGRSVVTLARLQATRPEQLPQGGSLVYWDGRTAAGQSVPAGQYRIMVTAHIGEQAHQATSPPVQAR